ncbi:MAG: DUF4239 domain-containing protein [Candidatus Obscuribacterales bacterium]|nr:DUF4239 domain-containing protein [Candidatus Obscuribacterales bacterium]
MNTNFPTLWILSGVATAVALVGLFIIKKTTNPTYLRKHHGVIDSILGVVGTLVSVLLGLLVAGALGRYEQINSEVSSESRSLSQIYFLACGLPEKQKTYLQKSCRDYCNFLIEQEWPAMEENHLLPEGQNLCRKIVKAVVLLNPQTQGESNIHNALIASVEDLGKGRRDRAESMRSGMHSTGATIFICSIIILILTFLYVTRGMVIHTVLTMFVAICLAMNIGLLHLLTSPFKAELKIKPTGFILDREIFDQLDKEESKAK